MLRVLAPAALVLLLTSAVEAKEEGVIVLTPRGFWYSEMYGDVHAGRDGVTGPAFDFERRHNGLGLDVFKLASPYADLEFPGELGIPFVANIKFWWLSYDGTARLNEDMLFNRTVFQADKTLVTDLEVLSLQVRLRVDIELEDTSLDIPFVLSPILGWSAISHDVKIKDPFEFSGKDSKNIAGTWPIAGLRVTFQPDWWIGAFAEISGIDFSWMSPLGIRIVQAEARAGLLLKFSNNWGVMVEYTYTLVHLERGRVNDGRSEIDASTVGPAMSIYASF